MQQTQALALLKTGMNVFLTGSAGAGKTYVLNQYIAYLKDRKIPVAVTASTGIAATHMNGMTIHAWSGIGVKQRLSDPDIKALLAKKYLRGHLENAVVLIIDEISMLHKQQLDMVDRVLRAFKKNDLPFGGIQVVFSGDFFQLPPIDRLASASRDKFAFMSRAWLDARPVICYITEQYRQSDAGFNRILNEIRDGRISEHARRLLDAARETSFNDDGEITRLFSHNVDVERINRLRLAELPGKVHTFKATSRGNAKLVEGLKRTVLAGPLISLKKNARVMFVKNNYDKGYINGTTGVVRSIDDDGYPIVRIADGSDIIVEPEEWSVQDDTGKALARYNQIPLRLAWAITVHKSQGMTLDRAEIDLRKTFEPGQGYVALSRLQNLAGLRLLGYNDMALRVDNLASKADKRFRELSREAEQVYPPGAALEQMALTFIRSSGGLSDPEKIDAHKKRRKERKNAKGSTYLVTKEFIEKGMSISDIAFERGLTENTIMSHVFKIHTLFPETDLSRFKPDDTLLERVKTVAVQLSADSRNFTDKGQLSAKALFDGLNGEVDYGTLKLALTFIEL